MATKLREDTRSVPALIGDIVRDLSDLVRQEIALAKMEASEKVSSLQTAVIAIAIGGAVLFAGLIVLLDAAVYALGNVMGPIVDRFPALPALIVGLLVVIIGAIMIKLGANRFSSWNMRLPRTTANFERDRAVVREHTS
jgi:hypothetical protein